MLHLYSNNTSGTTVVNNQNIVFENKALQTGCTATADTPTNTINLNKAGIYAVNFNAEISNDSDATELISVIMENNGVDIVSAQAGATSSSVTDVENISFTALVRVRPNCCSVDNTARLKFKVTGSNALVYFASVVVTKIV